MGLSFEQWIIAVMSGRSRGVGAVMTRVALAAVEPAYAGVAGVRNRRFDRGQRAIHRLPRPVISVGNLTTGGTGKTPAVQWLVRALQARGERPGVLLRGYRKGTSTDSSSDEEALLRESLGVNVVADADRVRGAATMLAKDPSVSVFVLDDGFQHRRVVRDADVVLIDATNPFGFGHVLPRGLLREPIAGVGRADLVIVTRSDQATAEELEQIVTRVRCYNAAAPIVFAMHRLTHALSGDTSQPIGELSGGRVLALSAIGNPAAFERSLSEVGIVVAATVRYGDHHPYVEADVESILGAARMASADRVVTTQKDWVKLRALDAVGRSTVPFVRAALQFSFAEDGDEIALETITARLEGVTL